MYPSKFLQGNYKCAQYIRGLVHHFWPDSNQVNFPAPQPRSLNRKSIKLINPDDYVVSEKSDGVRYLLVLGTYPRSIVLPPNTIREFAAFIDRRFQIYQTIVTAKKQFFKGTILDGELVWEFEKNLKTPRHLFLVFDIVAHKGERVGYRGFLERYELIHKIIDVFPNDILSEPMTWEHMATKLSKEGKIVSLGLGTEYCLQIRPKAFGPMKEIESIMANRKQLRHHSDGLIFMPKMLPVTAGSHPAMFKWKEHNTIDFLLTGRVSTNSDVVVIPGWVLNLFSADTDSHNNSVLVNAHNLLEKPIILIPNAVLLTIIESSKSKYMLTFQHHVECRMSVTSTHIECEIDKVRPDKYLPNHVRILKLTMESVLEKVEFKELVHQITKK